MSVASVLPVSIHAGLGAIIWILPINPCLGSSRRAVRRARRRTLLWQAPDALGLRGRRPSNVLGLLRSRGVAAGSGTTARDVDIRNVQRELLAQNVYLGEPGWLAESGSV